MRPIYFDLAERATELLGDGEWHPYEQTMRQLMKAVPPGIGLRKSEEDRLRLLKKRGVGEQPRTQPRDIEDQIWTGKRAVVREFLRNTKALETDKPGSNQPGGNHGRNIRLVRELRHTKGDPMRVERDRLRARNEELAEQVRFLRAYLIKIGHGSIADKLAPIPDDEDEAGMEDAL